MIVIDCDSNYECAKFKKQVTRCCYGAILLEGIDDWGKMRDILRNAKIELLTEPGSEELLCFVEKIYDGIS